MQYHYSRVISLLACLFFILTTSAQTTNPQYDSVLAKKLGADDYGMKTFTLVLLKTGPNTTASKTYTDSCFKGHMDNINRLVKEGKLIVAGPLKKNEKTYRGIFILDVADIKGAQAIVDTDPAVQGKLLAAELYTWFGSAALPLYLEASDKIWKSGF